MGWREVVASVKGWDGMTIGTDAAKRVADALAAMPPPDRLALARELLPAGFVVARDVTADDLPGIKAQILNRRAGVGEGDAE
jgi:hypothetical protein